jgi:hypothetical protein
MNAMANPVGRSGAGRAASSNRQKIILGGLSGVLAVVLAVELPSLLHRSSSSSSAPSTVTTTATAPAKSTATAAVPGTTTDAAAATGGTAVSSVATREHAIGRLPARDPFVPLARATTEQSTAPQPVAPPKAPAATEAATPAGPTAPAATDAATPVMPTAPVEAAPAPEVVPTAAVIVVDGRRQVIGLDREFTLGGATFRLASVAPDRITIAVDDASFAGGTKKITLRKAKQAWFENAATGVRYAVLFRSATNKTPTTNTATAAPSATAAMAADTTTTNEG